LGPLCDWEFFCVAVFVAGCQGFWICWLLLLASRFVIEWWVCCLLRGVDIRATETGDCISLQTSSEDDQQEGRPQIPATAVGMRT
jgi:hypothetical protein